MHINTRSLLDVIKCIVYHSRKLEQHVRLNRFDLESVAIVTFCGPEIALEVHAI